MQQESPTAAGAADPFVSDPDALRDWLLLDQLPGLGPVRRRQWLEDFHTPAGIRAAIEDGALSLPARGRQWLEQATPRHLASSLAWLDAAAHHHLIGWDSPAYPGLLREIPDPPVLLYVAGDPAVLQQPQLAIVGSRKPSAGGRDNAREFARALGRIGLTIASGLALGIDAAAHAGALDVASPTVAVLGNGLDRVYPARHRELAGTICEHGALISEFPPGTPPLAAHFPQRNRIISGLSLGVLVVEAAMRSGSLITARLAAEQGREVFAIPGSIHNPLTRGCHRLLRDGAHLVECLDDITIELGALAALFETPAASPAPAVPLGPDLQALLEHMGFDPVDIDTLVERSGLTAEQVSSMLLLLELQGKLAALGGGHFQRRHDTIPT
ncbi:MAG: DNA-processing protein DprA [Granulosicoccaceae bacterium]|jgi:DNA processing protein